ncbi:MAG: GNAT family N-acetyltransferase [Chitinophagaceae bacterium]
MQPVTPYKSFETDRLTLKPFAVTDAAFLLKLLNSPKWLQYIGDRKVYTEEEAANYINSRMITQLEKLGYGNNLVIRKEDNMAMGACGLYERPGLPMVDIGFAFLPAFEGKGYGYEAASRLLQAGKEEFAIQKVCAITIKENLTSQKLLLKLGLQFIKNIIMEGDKEELMYYEKEL